MRTTLYFMRRLTFIFIAILSFSSCKKEKEVFENNDPPPYEGISSLQVENYVNRLFIDLIGRESLDTEMIEEVSALEASGLTAESRRLLINKLQKNSDTIPGDSSYFIAYNKKLYEDTKARLLEGVSDEFIGQKFNLYEAYAYADSVNENFLGYEINKAISLRLKNIINSQYAYRANEITIQHLYALMLNNTIYDDINMNTFNFINASFDNLFYRFPTNAEFNQAFPIIEDNTPGQILGEVAQNKDEYLQILTYDTEFKEGLVTWAFLSLLTREPFSNERFDLVNQFTDDNDLTEIQLRILITDEYAGF